MGKIFKSTNMIERDALLARLNAEGIEAMSPHREISRKITDATVDLAYEGYSALMDGFDIVVPTADEDRAKAIVQDFLQEHRRADLVVVDNESDHWSHFYRACIFSVFLPVVFHLIALNHARLALVEGEKPSWSKLVFSILVFIFTGFTSAWLLKQLAS